MKLLRYHVADHMPSKLCVSCGLPLGLDDDVAGVGSYAHEEMINNGGFSYSSTFKMWRVRCDVTEEALVVHQVHNS